MVNWQIFFPLRGLRQRNPLFPYLFLMCAERLSCLINNAEKNGEIQGLVVTRWRTSISHFLFADDSILFCKTTIEEWRRVKNLLNIYEKGTYQVVNNKKSLIFFSSNTLARDKEAVVQEVRGAISVNYDRYPGLSTLIRKAKYNSFRWIKKMVWQKITNWKHKYLSQSVEKYL